MPWSHCRSVCSLKSRLGRDTEMDTKAELFWKKLGEFLSVPRDVKYAGWICKWQSWAGNLPHGETAFILYLYYSNRSQRYVLYDLRGSVLSKIRLLIRFVLPLNQSKPEKGEKSRRVEIIRLDTTSLDEGKRDSSDQACHVFYPCFSPHLIIIHFGWGGGIFFSFFELKCSRCVIWLG